MSYAVSTASGNAFALFFRALKVLRPDRPIHPRGTLLAGELTRDSRGRSEHSGIPWVDRTGSQVVTARFSRSVGLPAALPDILGLALRLHDGARPADILFASTGWSIPARFALLPHRDLGKATFTTLMPYKGARGPVLLGLSTMALPGSSLQPRDAQDWVLAVHFASPLGRWIRFGTLRLRPAVGPTAETAVETADNGQLTANAPRSFDTNLRFNPMRNVLPGAGTYAWARLLRERSYATAQKQIYPGAERETMVSVSKNFLASAADVWNVIADGWLYSGWVVGASRIRDVDALWPGQDAVLHHSVGTWPFLINDKTVVTASNPGKSIELIARGWPLGEAKVIITIQEKGMGCRVSIAEDVIKGSGLAVPKVVRDRLIAIRNRETLKRLELMASGGAGS